MPNSGVSPGDDLRRVEVLTVGLGLAAALVVGVRMGWYAGIGFSLGAGISWLNFRWLKQGVRAFARSATRGAAAGAARIPKRVWLRFLGRYALLLAVLCVILFGSWLPSGAVLAGLFTIVAAVLMDMIYRLFRGLRGTVR